jgi:hypothetical protein
VLEKFDFMVRFWNLRTRHDALGAPLSPFEQIELLSLLNLMASDHPLPEAGPPGGDHGVPVQLTAPGGFLAGELRVVCAHGIVIACASPLKPGQSTVVRLADAVSGVEYTLPCVVEWAFVGEPSSMALRVDGEATRVSFAAPDPGMWRSPLGWSERAWTLAE